MSSYWPAAELIPGCTAAKLRASEDGRNSQAKTWIRTEGGHPHDSPKIMAGECCNPGDAGFLHSGANAGVGKEKDQKCCAGSLQETGARRSGCQPSRGNHA